jgi:hypothetical protein
MDLSGLSLAGAGKMRNLVRCAHSRNLCHLEVEDGNTDEGGNNGGVDLGPEGQHGRDVHVVSQFEILGEVECMRRRDVSGSNLISEGEECYPRSYP